MPATLQQREPNAEGTLRPQSRRYRIAYVINSLCDGGAERQLLELLRLHDRQRFELALIMMEDRQSEKAVGLIDDLFVMGVPFEGNANWLPRTFRYLRGVQRTRAYLKRWKPDIVHAMLPASCVLGGMATLATEVPIFIRNPRSMMDQYRSRTRFGAWLDQCFLLRAECNIANSKAIATELVQAGRCPSEKCATIYNGVDLGRFHPLLSRTLRNRAGWTDHNIVLGMIANFSPVKRHADFVRAAELIAQKHPQVRFLMVGADYGTKRAVLSQIESCQLSSKFWIEESTTSPEDALAALDVYVCPSASEGLSNVILEAMACGKPVIATSVGGNPEAVLHWSTGLLVPTSTPEAIAEMADALVRDKNLRHLMGARGRKRVEEFFSLTAMLQATEQLYLKLLEKRRVSA